MLQEGDPVPDFDLTSDTAGRVKSADLRGQRYVLYFYPKDDTSGCTMEACSFRDNLPDFSSFGVPVYGISPDSVESHGHFRNKFSLTFPLLADTGHRTADAFGTWVEKHNYGRTYMGVQRSTFVVGPGGRIEHVWPKVNPSEHAKEVLTYLRSASAPESESRSESRSESHSASESAADQSAPLPIMEPAPAVPVEGVPMMSTEQQSSEMPMPEMSMPEMPMPEEPVEVVEEIVVVAVPEAAPATKRPARKSSTKKTATKKSASKKAAAKKGAAKKATKKTAAKKGAAKKATKKAGARKTTRR